MFYTSVMERSFALPGPMVGNKSHNLHKVQLVNLEEELFFIDGVKV